MNDHDIVKTEDGFVVCRCGQTFSGESTGEAEARHRRHWTYETTGRDAIAASRAALKGDSGDT